MACQEFVFWTGEGYRKKRRKERHGMYTLYCMVFKVGTKILSQMAKNLYSFRTQIFGNV
jgi:hypothetical protein